MAQEDAGTKPEAGDETTTEEVQFATPEAGREQAQPDQSESQEQGPSERTVEYAKYEAAVREMNERQRESAQLREENERFRRFAEELAGREQARVNPEETAYQRWIEARFTDDEPTRYREYEKLRDSRIRQEAVQQALQQFHVTQQLPRANEILGQVGVNDPQAQIRELQTVAQGLNAEEAAYVVALRRGKLADVVSTQQKKRERDAKRAELLNSLGQSGGHRIPGSEAGGRGKTKVDWVSYASKSRKVRAEIDKLVENGEVEIVNMPGT